MDKGGRRWFQWLTVLSALVLAVYGAAAFLRPAPAYTLTTPQFCEVGNGIPVSGFVVRSELCLQSENPLPLSLPEGQWVSAGQDMGEGVRAPYAGYLSHVADGYESLLTPESVTSLSLQDYQALQALPADSAFARLIFGQDWYFLCPMPAQALPSEEDLQLRIGDCAYPVSLLRKDELLLLHCDEGLHQLTALRQTEAELLLSNAPCQAICAEALYYEDGQSFVYVLEAGRVRRKTVTVLALCGEHIHIEGLRETSQVIVTDKELTEGMLPE